MVGFNKLVRLMAVLLALAAAVATQPFAADSDFCWKDSYTRGVGTTPQSCAAGQDRIGLLCYPRCRPGMTRVGTDCHSICPDGLRDDGLFCRAAEYGRGSGYPWKFGDPLTDSGMLSRCEADNGRGRCEMSGAIAYPACKQGYEAVGCCVCRPVVPNCAALGLNPGIDLSCGKKVEIGSPVIGTCAPGEQSDAGLCYPSCKTAYGGVGPVCWGQCPATHPVNCAGGCAKTQDACALNTTDQVLSVLEMVANVGLAVATAGTSTVATAGAKAGATAAKVASKTGAKFAARITRQEVLAIIKKQAKEAGKELSQAALETYVDAVVQAGTTGEFDPSVLAGLDPTGVASIVVAYNKPVCSAPSDPTALPPTRVSAALQQAIRPTTGSPPTVAAAGGQSVALQGIHGKFVVAEPSGAVFANRATAGPWERFALQSNADGSVSFKSAHGKYLVAEPNGAVNANRDAVGAWEKFSLTRNANGTVSLKTAHGKYLTAEADGRLTATRAQAGAGESFTLR